MVTAQHKTGYRSRILSDTFATAAENMRFDEALMKQAAMAAGERFFRLYEWQKAGITYPEKRPFLPSGLQAYDRSSRVSGGGILFHSPGDLVFSFVARLDDPFYPKRLKEKMMFLCGLFKETLQSFGIEADRGTSSGKADLMFCNTYENPYEVFVKGEKICAFAFKKERHLFIVQGIVHLHSNYEAFPALSPDYDAYFSAGLAGPAPDAGHLGKRIAGLLGDCAFF